MLPCRKLVLLCRMMMLLWACYWCLGGFTPDRVWAEEKSAESSPTTGSSSQESSWLNPLTWKYKPTDEELLRYRKSWNPFSHSPILANSPDVQPKGQWLVQGFLFSAIAHDRFPNRFGTGSVDAPTHIRAISPTVFIGYGITDNIEVDFVPSLIWYDTNKPNATTPGKQSSDMGLGDTTIYLKTRIRVQDPDSWHPTVTFFHNITLPTSQWMGTHPIPGGFAPLGRLPATKFGGLGLTEGIMFRKNIEPFRFMLSGYYTYTLPGSTAGMNTYNGDIINTRGIIEWVADDKNGLAFSLEFLSVHGLPYRLDGHDLNPTNPISSPTSFSLIGFEPSVQYNIFYDRTGALAVAAGAIYTIAGQNAIDAIYPNISMYYYWNSTGKVLMR